jgi:hypothetical protein
LKARSQNVKVFTHSFHDHDHDDFYDDDAACYDIETPISLILANSTERRNQRPGRNGKSNMVRIPRDKWFNLDAACKEIWDKLDNKAKSIILGNEPPKPATSTTFTSFQPPSSNHQLRVNLHDSYVCL